MNYSEKEKKAIEYWKRDIKLYHYNTQLASEHYAQIVLNLIQKQDKIIDKMAEILEDLQIAHFKKDEYGGFYGYRTYNKEDWKEYFKKEVEKECEN